MDHRSLRTHVRDVADFPSEGVVFRDITPLLGDASAFSQAVSGLVEEFSGVADDRVVGVGSRGFISGAALAYRI
ncbi:MAG: adenine phosphoribosyltransferase, partial [Ilumatobacter sp.]